MWEEFLEKHATWDLINPDIGARFNEAKAFKVSAKTLPGVLQALGPFLGRGLKGFRYASSGEDLESVGLHAQGISVQASKSPPRTLYST
jgi:hypothetical protein